MSRSTDEARIRELMQRLRSADAQLAPDFHDVLQRPRPASLLRPTRPVCLAAAGCAAATVLLAVCWLMRPQQGDSNFAADPNGAPRVESKRTGDTTADQSKDEPSIEIDFDHLREVVHQHCRTPAVATRSQMPVWSGHTDSLLAWNGGVSITQE